MSKITDVLDRILQKIGTGEQLTIDEQEIAITNALLEEDEEDGE